jgi:hypothetical protein
VAYCFPHREQFRAASHCVWTQNSQTSQNFPSVATMMDRLHTSQIVPAICIRRLEFGQKITFPPLPTP